MMIALVILSILALFGIAASAWAVARDGYRRMPRHGITDLDPEERFAAH